MNRALSTLAAVVLFAVPARAQTDPVTAQALFDDAKRLMASGHVAEACPKLAESQRLDPGVGTLLNLGDCYDRVGKPSRAWATFREAEAAAQHEGQSDRVRYAKRRAAETEAKLVRLTVDVPDDVRIPSLEVLRDGEALREPLWGSAVPVDPGDHLVEVRAPGYKTFESRVTATHDPIVVRVTPLEKEAPQTVEPPPPIALTTPPITFESERGTPLPPPPPPTSSAARTAGFVTGGIGLVGVAIGALFGVLAIDRDNSARSAGCDATTCPTVGALGLSNDAKSFALTSDVAFIAGGVFLVTGIICFLAAPKSPAARVAHAMIFGGTF
jgi:serine/threonine-protein kinase